MSEFLDVPISRIFLYLKNPRHEPVETEAQAIERLCGKEDIYPLARDIALHGLNPLERFALMPQPGTKGQRNYIVPEGNRRMCALKLLSDPDLAPPKLRKPIEKLAQTWSPISTVPAVIFDDIKEVEVWLDRIHNGPQGGIGRKQWSADQKQRFDGEGKNKTALAILDYAEAKKMLTADERKEKLTTAQRFLSNVIFRETLGVDQIDTDNIGRTRPEADFDVMVKRFVRDLVGNKLVHSRMNKSEINQYARSLGSLDGISNERVESESLTTKSNEEKPKPNKKPQKPQKAKHVQYEEAIYTALRTLGNEKLDSLYHSICSIELNPHTPIIAVGTWSFFETLTACCGRTEGVSFDSFLSKHRLKQYGISDTVTVQAAINRIREYGNTTKHHPLAATFNGDQLHNDMNTLKDLILACIADASTKGT